MASPGQRLMRMVFAPRLKFDFKFRLDWHRRQRLILQIVLVACLVISVSVVPSDVGVAAETAVDIDKAPILIDGRKLFKVANSGNFTAAERAKTVNTLLEEKLDHHLKQNEPIRVEAVPQQDQAILQVNNRYLLTVTEADVMPGMQPIEQARLWEDKIEIALENSVRERSPAYRRWAVKCTLIGFAIAIAAQIGLFLLSRRLRRIQLQRSEAEQGSPKLLALLLLQITVWIVAICHGMSLFPYTRRWLYQGSRFLNSTFNSRMFELGGEALSLTRLLSIGLSIAVLWLLMNRLTQFLKNRILPLAGVDRSLQDSLAFFTEYGLVSMGILLILSAGGVSFQSLVLLMSVVGVGLGFGLQNIFKDFISGLILILSRPIKVGELVQVGEFQGLVQRIGARTTEISNIDRYIITVPNSRFIEGEVLNWNRSGLTRVKVYVDIAYGSDFARVYKVLLAAAQVPHKEILKHPPPKAQFRGYGESALNFRIVVFIRDPLKEPKVRTHINDQIQYHFQKYGIEVPFPQRDLHIKAPYLDQALETWVRQHIPDNGHVEESGHPTDIEEKPPLDDIVIREEYDWEMITAAMRGKNGVERKDRRFGLKRFRNVFLGSEAVDWLMIYEQATRMEALMMGQIMLKEGIIHHVLDEHEFKDEPLFYRFYADEKAMKEQGMADEGGIDGDEGRKDQGLEKPIEGEEDESGTPEVSNID
ncbi:MAG: mechanosensitive ion channel domain-containing protein [Microcoleaceae cyanobacterium]